MQRQAQRTGGTLEIQSAPGKGAKGAIAVPTLKALPASLGEFPPVIVSLEEAL